MDSNKFYKPFENNKDEMPKSNYKDKILSIIVENYDKLIKIIPVEEIQKEEKIILQEMDDLEKVATPEKAKKALTKEVAEKAAVIWDLSGPGNYDNAYKKDRYIDFPWSRKMERDRLNYTAWLSRLVAESLSDEKDINTYDTKTLIEKYGPKIIYCATEEENDGVKDLLERDGIMIPKNNVIIPDVEIINTRDQVEKFSLPTELHIPGKEIWVVSHSPHLVRTMHMIEKFQTLPKDMVVRLFPVQTPPEGKEEYTKLETGGTLMYIYAYSAASKETYPYIIHGEEK
jgi:hypothetical protein